MAVHIRLSRHGTKKSAFYRIIVADHRSPRDGRFIENIGVFDPAPSGKFEINRARFDYWRGKGAVPSATLGQLLKKHPAAPAAV
jgi:small subunit ribosomal protein S16